MIWQPFNQESPKMHFLHAYACLMPCYNLFFSGSFEKLEDDLSKGLSES